MMNKNNRTPDAKLAVLGRAAVGKSALVVRYLTGRFIWEYDPTLECTYKHTTMVDDDPVTMEILDTAGQEENIAHRECQARWADGFALVYSICDRSSFNDIRHIKQFIDDVNKSCVPCVLLGNKCDLYQAREVSTEEGQILANEFCCSFYEISASDGGEVIPETFAELYKDVRRQRFELCKHRRRSSATIQVKQVISKVFRSIQSSS